MRGRNAGDHQAAPIWLHVRGPQDHPLLAGLSRRTPRTQHLVLVAVTVTVERAQPRGGGRGAVCGGQALASKGPVPRIPPGHTWSPRSK